MIYLDASVALAQLLSEEKRPPESLSEERLTASKLLAYEVWNRLNALGMNASHRAVADELLGRIEMVDLSPEVLLRALDPFPVELRTLDALHVATMVWLIGEKTEVRLASYDRRMIACAEALGVELFPL